MKILQVITSMRIGGAEKLVAEMAPRMQNAGHQVDVLLFDGTNTPLKEQLEKEGINVYHLAIGKSVYHPLFIFQLIAYLKKYDIIHTHNTACQLFVALASLFITKGEKPRLITTEHSTTNRRRKWAFYKFIDRWMYQRYHHVVAISEIAKEKLHTYLKQSSSHIHVIPNGINLQAFQQDYSLSLKQHSDDVILTMVAGFRKGKDQMTLIKAMKELPNNYHLYLVGDGILKNNHEQFVNSLSLQDRVHFLGIRNDIPAILKASDIVLMSSEYEGLSLSNIEGMASGKPFLASDVDGLREITKDAGILFPLGNIDILIKEIVLLMNDNKHYMEVCKRCLQKASLYNINNTITNYLKIYNPQKP